MQIITFFNKFMNSKAAFILILSMFLLNSCHVALVAGDAFGNPECVRISYAASDKQLIEAAKRIQTQLNTLK